MSKIINHKAEQKVFTAKEKFDKEKYIDELVDRLTRWSNEILSYDPKLIIDDRQDLIYEEDGMLLWRTNTIKQLPEYDMYTIKTLLEKRNEQHRYNPYMGQISRNTGYSRPEQNTQAGTESYGVEESDNNQGETTGEGTSNGND